MRNHFTKLNSDYLKQSENKVKLREDGLDQSPQLYICNDASPESSNQGKLVLKKECVSYDPNKTLKTKHERYENLLLIIPLKFIYNCY